MYVTAQKRNVATIDLLLRRLYGLPEAQWDDNTLTYHEGTVC